MKRKLIFGCTVLAGILLTASCKNDSSDPSYPPAKPAEKIIIGNIITMDEKTPTAEAVAVKDGVIVAVGNKDFVKKFVSDSAETLHYEGRYVYPGFMENHAHGMLAGQRAIGQANLLEIYPRVDYEEYKRIITTFIQKNPNKEVYVAAGWAEDGTPVDHTYLDGIESNKPLIMNTSGGHSCLLNKKAMEKYGIDDAAVTQWGTDRIHVGADGHPNGYVCEEPAIDILKKIPVTLSEIKDYLLKWQEIAFAQGITATGDAGIDMLSPLAFQAYKELQQSGKLKLRTYAYLVAEDNLSDPAGKALDVANKAKEANGKYFKIIGLKAFIDGVIEAHTAWLLDDYSDKSGYKGVARFNDTEKMKNLIVEAQNHGLSVHVHSEGDQGTQFMLNCIEQAQNITGNRDQRNAISHLHLVADSDIQRFADTNTIAVVPPQWVAAAPGLIEQEEAFIGQTRSDNTFPIKSFIDKGAKTVFHSDYPISPSIDAPETILMATTRGTSKLGWDKFEQTKRNTKEAITRQQSLEALTTNIAYAWHEENRLGSITAGKIANFTVMDTDFLTCGERELPDAKVMATIVDGDVVFKRNQ